MDYFISNVVLASLLDKHTWHWLANGMNSRTIFCGCFGRILKFPNQHAYLLNISVLIWINMLLLSQKTYTNIIHNKVFSGSFCCIHFWLRFHGTKSITRDPYFKWLPGKTNKPCLSWSVWLGMFSFTSTLYFTTLISSDRGYIATCAS